MNTYEFAWIITLARGIQPGAVPHAGYHSTQPEEGRDAMMRMLAACTLALAAGSAWAADEEVLPEGADVPRLGEAIILDHRPQARMISDTTCELIAAAFKPDGSLMLKGEGYVQLYRWGTREPIDTIEPREDGLVVAFFEARPGERVLGRSAIPHPRRRGNWILGNSIPSTCHGGGAMVQDPQQMPPDN